MGASRGFTLAVVAVLVRAAAWSFVGVRTAQEVHGFRVLLGVSIAVIPIVPLAALLFLVWRDGGRTAP